MNQLADTTSFTSSIRLFYNLTDWGLVILVFVATSSIFYFVARRLIRRGKDQQSRLRRISPPESSEEAKGAPAFGPLGHALAAQIPESKKERRDFRLLLRQAGLYGPQVATTIYAMRFVLLLVPLVAAGCWAVLADREHTFKILFFGGMTAAALSAVPRLYVFFRRRRRMHKIRQGLADTIDMLSMCSSGGMGLNESLEHVAGQMSSCPGLAHELTILKRQAEVGSLKQALADLTARVDLPEVRHLATLLTRGSSLGSKLAGSLNEQADHLRTARRQAAVSRANKTPVKLVLPVLFCFAPAALILLTAPAVLELYDFLVPTQQAASTAEAPSFGTGAIFETLDGLDQRPATVITEAPPDVAPSY